MPQKENTANIQNEADKKYYEERMKEVPSRYQDSDIRKLDKELSEKIAQNLQGHKGLYLWGGAGTGKTYIAYSIFKRSVEIGNGVRIYNFSSLLRNIRKNELENPTSRDYEGNILDDEVLRCSLLILDDLGTEKISEWGMEMLYLIINGRYEKELLTVFTSNLSPDELAERIGDRLVSRIIEMCGVIKIEGNDRRVRPASIIS